MSRSFEPPPLGNKLIGFGEVGRIVGVDPATPWRWATRGTKLPDGSRLHLASWALPGRRVTTEEAVRDFIERLTEARQGQADPPPASHACPPPA